MQTLEEFLSDVLVFTKETFIQEKSKLENLFLLQMNIKSEDIEGRIKNDLSCDNELVQEWIALHALEPYLEKESSAAM